MSIFLKKEFWIFIISIIGTSSMQENEDYMYGDFLSYDNFQIKNSEILRFNDSYCLENISVVMIPSSDLSDNNLGIFYIKIMWSSKFFMSSLKVESDSLSDTYCEAQNKHYYCREPLNQKFHVFPDDVNEGVRFFPFKLDCKYIITPEFEGPCKPLQLNYLTPVCLNHNTCSCRNVLIPGPVVKYELQQDGINIIWSSPQNISNNIHKTVLTIYEEDGINIEKTAQKVIPTQNFTYNIDGREHFKINFTRNNYGIQAYFENTLGCRGATTFVRFRNAEIVVVQSLQEKVVAFLFAVLLLLLFVSLIWLFFRRKKKYKKIYKKIFRKNSIDLQTLEYFSNNCNKKKFILPPMECNTAYLEQDRDSYWFDYRDLIIERQIGCGNFGIVYFATSQKSLNGVNVFAVKQIKDDSGPDGLADFLDEINIFKQVGSHPNIVKMFGYCNAPNPLSIIMEYVPFNLLKYLKNLRVKFESRKFQMTNAIKYTEINYSSHNTSDDYISQTEVESIPLKENKPVFDEHNSIYYVLDNRELETFALHIARGMAHLESKAIVHRDLAARNVLMDEYKNLKISDFGMSREGIYVNKRTRNFPLRWMSPEALSSRTFSNKSDVWSFGVVLWEIATLGAFPYATLQNEEVMSFLKKGGHLNKPENVTKQLYTIMENCWKFHPEDRPTFADTMLKLEGFCQKSSGYVDFENLTANYVFPPTEEEIDKIK